MFTLIREEIHTKTWYFKKIIIFIVAQRCKIIIIINKLFYIKKGIMWLKHNVWYRFKNCHIQSNMMDL